MTSPEPIVTRHDGVLKVTGAARYAADHVLPNQLYAVLVGASIPAGRVTGIDASATLARQGVVKVLTASDMPRASPKLREVGVPPLATRFLPMQSDQVMYEGQAVAIVLAETLQAAEAGARLLKVRYARTEFLVPEQASAQPVDPERGGYSKAGSLVFRKGDADAALARAERRFHATYSQPSRHGNPMEPSAIVAHWQEGRLTVYDAVQHLPAVQGALAAAFGIDAGRVRVVAPHTGGGFGTKAFIWPHEILACQAASVVQRPVKLVLTRQQQYSMVGYQPQITQRIALGADAGGRLEAIRHDSDNVTGITDDYVEFTSAASKASYACANIATTQSVRRGHVVLPTFMRSPWDGPGSFALGSAIDELARELGMDPLALSLANYAERDPESGKPWSSKKMREAYEEGARRFGWRGRPKGGTRDGAWYIGYGMADCGQGQARFPSSARVRLLADGTARVESGLCDIGTGPATIFAQVAAAELGLDPAQVKVVAGDSDLPYAGPTYGSATTISTGPAVQQAAREVRARLARLAGSADDMVELREGRLRDRKTGRPLGAIRDIMAAAGVGELSATHRSELPGGAPIDMGGPEAATRSFGVIFVEVGVDPELGLLRLRRATGVYSAGRIINPLTARSQMIGGIVWGWGMAALEASHYEPALGRFLAKDLAGVAIPVNADIPSAIDVSFVDEFDARSGPLGAKGIGELGSTGVAAAVANAVYDAIGVRVRDLPITPEKLVRRG